MRNRGEANDLEQLNTRDLIQTIKHNEESDELNIIEIEDSYLIKEHIKELHYHKMIHNQSFSKPNSIILTDQDEELDLKDMETLTPNQLALPMTIKPQYSNSLPYGCAIQAKILKKQKTTNLQQLRYDYEKELSHIKINKDDNFMNRMVFDVFKRKEKEKVIDKLVEKSKIKLNEDLRIDGFNRLIKDANRRLEIRDTLEEKKLKLDEQVFELKLKKYREFQWDTIYSERFAKFENNKNKKLNEKRKEKKEKEAKKEKDLISKCKQVKKVPSNIIQKTVTRLHATSQKKNNNIALQTIDVNINHLRNYPSKSQLDSLDTNNKTANYFSFNKHLGSMRGKSLTNASTKISSQHMSSQNKVNDKSKPLKNHQTFTNQKKKVYHRATISESIVSEFLKNRMISQSVMKSM